MKIELRNVKHSRALSEETFAFVAEIWIDGVKSGTARNDGRGGANRIEPHNVETAIETHAKTLPPIKTRDGTTLTVDADLLISDLVADDLIRKELARRLKRTVMFAHSGKLYVSKERPVRDYDTILNDLPFDAALQLYKAFA